MKKIYLAILLSFAAQSKSVGQNRLPAAEFGFSRLEKSDYGSVNRIWDEQTFVLCYSVVGRGSGTGAALSCEKRPDLKGMPLGPMTHVLDKLSHGDNVRVTDSTTGAYCYVAVGRGDGSGSAIQCFR